LGGRALLRLKSVTGQHLRLICQPKSIVILGIVLFALGAMPLPAANAASVTLGWDSNTEPDLEGYVIYRNTNSPGPPYSYSDEIPEDELADPLHPQATLTGLQEGDEYYIALTAYNTDGVESSYSSDVCVDVVNGIVEPCSESAGPVDSSSSGISDSSDSGGSGGGCFISTVSHGPPGNNLLLYILLPLIIIIAAGSMTVKRAPEKNKIR